ncbi:MAG: hypothetical protein ACOVQ6_20560, partial [Brevundimonas sp.]
MRSRFLAFTAVALCLSAPAAVADATQAAADAAASAALIQNPRGCGTVGSVLDAADPVNMVMVDGFG